MQILLITTSGREEGHASTSNKPFVIYIELKPNTPVQGTAPFANRHYFLVERF